MKKVLKHVVLEGSKVDVLQFAKMGYVVTSIIYQPKYVHVFYR